MGNIVLLDDLTINQIAAGEVIERPASVIKEMVENSIDAGATNIVVEIKNGGISFIKITDNGKGIAEDDLEIAFERHATSKIRSANDLNEVQTMGFRGEALASIAAISSVELVSKTEEQQNGYKIIVQAGDVLEKSEIGCQKGTSITVRNLFFNTPVRYKFLKKDYTESGYIEDVIARIALVNPQISIKLINTGKTIIQTNGSGELKDVIYSIFGKDVANGVIETTYQYEDIKITGVVGKPEIARSNRSNQLFFVNKRYIKDKTLSAATEQGYKGLIPIGKFGFVIFNIEINPSQVDVNVHPAKLEVRFQEESKVFQAIYHTVKDTLLKSELVSNGENSINKIERTDESFEERLKKIRENNREQKHEGLFGFRKQNETKIEEYTEEESKIKTNIVEDIDSTKVIDTSDVLEKLRQMREKVEEKIIESNNSNVIEESKEKYNLEVNNNSYSKIQENIEINSEEPKDIKEEAEDAISRNESEIKKNDEKQFENMYAKLFGKEPPKDDKNIEEVSKPEIFNVEKDNVSVFDNEEKLEKPIYKFIGIVFKTYIILEIDKEMYILDQHAAHERILYEKVKKNYYENSNKDSQMLLLPDVITLTHKEMDIAKENFEMFERAGFTLEEFGENTIKLIGVPTVCIDLDTKELFLETLDGINTIARTAKQEKEERFIATVACKAAVKANMALNKEEVDELMDKLLELPNPFTCPHGRPTVIKMSKNDIDKKFDRT